MQQNPILVDVYRKDIIESCHRGSVLVVNHKGETVFSLGDVERHIYPRSSLKLFQAIPLVETGAVDHYGLSDAELALACASHNGETIHTETVEKWLARLQLGVDDLENGPTMPMLGEAKHQLIRNDEQPSRLHQNCSGKHTGMLTLAKFLGHDTAGYSEHQHPAQLTWMKVFSELVDLDIASLAWERDGCGLPAICMPMKHLAYGCALFARPDSVGGKREEAMRKIISAIAANPHMLAGKDRCCTDVIAATKGSVIVKTGAEAVYIAILPEQGLGVALKIDDGSSRGSEVALGAVLSQLGAIDETVKKNLDRHFCPQIRNSQGNVTGQVVASDIWNT